MVTMAIVYERRLDLGLALKTKSLFLFGPRQTGKSTLIRQQLKGAQIFDLLDVDTYLRLASHPQLLESEILPKTRLVVIDEVQKCPQLLDSVHRLIEQKSMRFLLTGSSARALRAKGVNLLGGRARSRQLHPLSCMELGKDFDLNRALKDGLIPSIFLSDSPDEDLKAYARDYLQQEIIAAAATRNAPSFQRFLAVAAQSNAQKLNLTKIANDAQVKRTTLYSYLEILNDTMIAKSLKTWRKSKNRKAEVAPKFYLFDTGLARYLQGRKSLSPKTPEYGEAFEAYIHHELITFLDYRHPSANDEALLTWRSESGFEVDFILNEETAIEVKASGNVGLNDLRGLRALREERKLKRFLIVALVEKPRRLDFVEVLPYKHFLNELWA